MNEKMRQEIFSQLEPVSKNDWLTMRPGTLILHKTANNLLEDQFVRIHSSELEDFDTGTITFDVVVYKNSEGKQFTLGLPGWYYFDQDLVDTVKEKYAPKLFRYQTTLFVATTDEHLVKKLEEITGTKISMKALELLKNHNEVEEIKQVSGYNIVLD